MNGRKLAFEVVPENEYTDFSDRENKKSHLNNGLLIAATGATASLATYAVTSIKNTTQTTIPTINPTPITPPTTTTEEPLNVLAHIPTTIPVDSMTPE